MKLASNLNTFDKRLIYSTSGHKPQTKSVMTTPAMFTNHVQGKSIPIPEPQANPGPEAYKYIGLGHYEYLFTFMEDTGCRISEAIEIAYERITDRGSVLIIGKKRSSNRWIPQTRITDYLLKCKELQQNPFSHLNTFSAIRHLKKLHIGIQKKGRKRLTVTGIYREQYAKNIRSINADDKSVSQFIGHKSKTNAKFYGKD